MWFTKGFICDIMNKMNTIKLKLNQIIARKYGYDLIQKKIFIKKDLYTNEVYERDDKLYYEDDIIEIEEVMNIEDFEFKI